MPIDSPEVEKTPPSNVNLWTRDFSLVTFATVLGAAGGIAGEFALSFFVFDETGSTLASALVIAIQLVPHVFVPLIVSVFAPVFLNAAKPSSWRAMWYAA